MKNQNGLKEFLFLVPAAVISAGAFFGFQKSIPTFPKISKLETKAEAETSAKDSNLADLAEIAEKARSREAIVPAKKQKKKRKKKIAQISGKTWKDGSFTGNGTGFGGTIRVNVKIKKAKITAINILSCSGETPAYFSKAKALTKKIVSAQSLDVNAISGATYSSEGILEAMADALGKAGDVSQKKKIHAKKDKPEPEKDQSHSKTAKDLSSQDRKKKTKKIKRSGCVCIKRWKNRHMNLSLPNENNTIDCIFTALYHDVRVKRYDPGIISFRDRSLHVQRKRG